MYRWRDPSILSDSVVLTGCNECSIGVVDVWDRRKALVEQNSRCSRYPDHDLPIHPQMDIRPPRNPVDIAVEDQDCCCGASSQDPGPPYYYRLMLCGQ